MERLDRLPGAKHIAQVASVLGRGFDRALLVGVAELDEEAIDVGLAQLEQAEIVNRRGSSRDDAYVFKHALLRDTAYQSLLRSTRQRLHGRTADALERDFPERAEREPERLARHLNSAELYERATTAFQRAGEQAVTRFAYPEAIRHFREALELLMRSEENAERVSREAALQLALGDAIVKLKGFKDPEVGPIFERVEALAEKLEDGYQQLPPLMGLAMFHVQLGDGERWQRYGGRVLALANDLDIPLLQAAGHMLCGNAAIITGPIREALDHFECARSICGKVEAPPPVGATDIYLPIAVDASYGAALAISGGLDRAIRLTEENIVRARDLGHPGTLSTALSLGNSIHRHLGNVQRTGEIAEELIQIAIEYGLHTSEAFGLVCSGWAAGESGIEDAKLGLERAAASGAMGGLTDSHFAYVELLARCERWEEVVKALDVATEIGRRAGDLATYNSQYATLRAECARLHGASQAEREAIFLEALQTIRANGRFFYELGASVGLARLWVEQGRHDEARDLLRPLCERITEGAGIAAVAEARAMLDSLS
jgi:tetratricopeptide (TPR) repeat protein